MGGARIPACPMSVHYADQRALASGLAKNKVVDFLLKVMAAAPGGTEALIGAGISDEAAALSWADVAIAARQVDLPAQPRERAPHLDQPPPAEDVESHADKKRKRRVDKRPSHKDRVQRTLSG